MKKVNNRTLPSPTKMLRALFLASISIFFLFVPLLAQQQNEDNTLHIPPKLNVQVSTGEEALTSIMMGRKGEWEPSQSNKIFIDRDEWRATIPLLPMVFFDQGSSAIPERYQTLHNTTEVSDYKETNGTVRNQLDNDENENIKYLEVLNIIGYRMRRHPETTIQVEGGYSREPGESAELASERGDVIREYLQNVWHIPPERIETLPPRIMADSSSNILQQEEARRVIIHTDDWQLISPVNYSHSSFNATFAVFSISLDPWILPDDIAKITMLISSGDDLLSATQLPISQDSTTYRYVGLWVVPRQQNQLESSLEIEALIETHDGRLRKSNRVSIPIEVEEPYITFENNVDSYLEEEVSEMELSFFGSGDSTLGKLQLMMLEQAIEGFQKNKQLLAESGTPIEFVLSAQTEVSENPLADFTRIQAERSSRLSRESMIGSMFRDPTFHVPLYIVPSPLLTPTKEKRDSRQEMVNNILQTWFGDRFDEIEKFDERPEFTHYVADEEVKAASPLITSRLSSVVTWLANRIDTSQVLLRLPDPQNSTPRHQLQSYSDRPEDRFYARSIHLYLSTVDEYEYDDGNGEDGEFDEYYDDSTNEEESDSRTEEEVNTATEVDDE
ncbi:MAG: hypothetical protein KDD67_17220 [Ignavibacteriae bacterium]|nr:hypothetical protein [Ignavibacteriota bacterium]